MVGPRRLGDHVTALDTARFTGRRRILEQLDRLLAGIGNARVAFVHGPGGIGKSALLREVRRRATAAGRAVWSVDARSIEPVPGALESLLDDATDQAGAVVLVDSFERIAALDGLLRQRILPCLAADAVVVVAGRRDPNPAWFRDGWEHVVADIPLGPLRTDEARDLLAAQGVGDPAVATPLIAWAGGSPLALSLAAAAGPTAHAELTGMDLNRLIVDRLSGNELREVDRDVLDVAAICRAVDARLLAAAVPGRPTRTAYETLRRSSVAELVEARLTLHDLVRAALREQLRTQDPQRYGRLRCAVADHLLARTIAGEPRLLFDLIELIDDPEVRWGIGGNAHVRVRIDPWRPDEVDRLVQAYVDSHGDARWWSSLAPLLADAPELGLVARDVEGEPLGFCVATSAAQAPAAAERDPVLGPLLADARAWDAERAMIFRETFQLPGTGDVALGVLNLSAVLRSGRSDIGRTYILDTAPDESSVAFLQAIGATHHPHLDTEIAGRLVECWVVDLGPDGLPGALRQVIYAEAGRDAPDQEPHSHQALHLAALDAVRDFGRPEALATNPLVAHPRSPDERSRPVGERVEQLRATIVHAVAETFDHSPGDRLLRQVVELADLDPDLNHDQVMARVPLSRATYFRHLRRARRRVADAVVDRLASPA